MGNNIYGIHKYCKELCSKKRVREEDENSSSNKEVPKKPKVEEIPRPTLVIPQENTHTIV